MARRKTIKAHVEGADALNEALRAVGGKVSGLLLQKAAKAGAEVIAEEAARLAPKDTGALSDGIVAEAGRLQQGRAQINVGPGKDEWYGAKQEFGTERMPAQPFLRPAFDAKAEEAQKAVENVLRDALKDVLD